MEYERDEMHRLMTVKLNEWRHASRNVLAVASQQMGSKGGKANKPNPN